MSNEFYKYIARQIISFFQEKKISLRRGERYCLKLDNEEMVYEVEGALLEETAANNIQGSFCYKEEVYRTFTIKLAPSLEVVVAAKSGNMTDDFLATLRNANLTDEHFPILMLTYATIDTITSGTGDLTAKGMPFHADILNKTISDSINKAELTQADRVLLQFELNEKRDDRFSDKTSLYEYKELLTIIGRGSVADADYASFRLLCDHGLVGKSAKEQKNRLVDNQALFEKIDRIFRSGNIEEDLSDEFDSAFLRLLQERKKQNEVWYDKITYDEVLASMDKKRSTQSNPLKIESEDISAYAGSALEYSFGFGEQFFVCDDKDTKAGQRKKNILIFNPDHKENITIQVDCNINLRGIVIKTNDFAYSILKKTIFLEIEPTGCTFGKTTIIDGANNVTYAIKVCVIDLIPAYFKAVATDYLIKPTAGKKGTLQIQGVKHELVINEDQTEQKVEIISDGQEYECNYNQTLKLRLDEESMDLEKGFVGIAIKCGSIVVPAAILDEPKTVEPLIGIRAFKKKYEKRRGFNFRNADAHITYGAQEYYAKDEQFQEHLLLEQEFLHQEALCLERTLDGAKPVNLQIAEPVKATYKALITELKRRHQLPSLAYYDDDLQLLAKNYVSAFRTELEKIKEGQTLLVEHNDLLHVGTVISNLGEQTIEFSPLHPLNVLYQLKLLDEDEVGFIRDDLVEKITSTNLIPFIRDQYKNLYRVVDQRHSPEWNCYAFTENKRYQGARNFVPKLVCEKIEEYKKHFEFLFSEIDNENFTINLVNMGDCCEVLQGIVRYYLKAENFEHLEDALKFTINIYGNRASYNDFSLLADNKRLRQFLQEQPNVKNEEISDLLVALTTKISCYFKDHAEPTYAYSHLAFYEMDSATGSSDSRMADLATGVSLSGLISGVPSVYSAGWYKTGFGYKYAESNNLTDMAATLNALYRVTYSSSAYLKGLCITTEVAKGSEVQLDKIYNASNWVVFVDPKVDLSFFLNGGAGDDLMIIHYSDQFTNGNYEAITVTKKSKQYEQIIHDQLLLKGVSTQREQIRDIINLFNAVNGDWLLRLISARKAFNEALDSNFSREKMSILSAIKVAMAYYSHPDIVWVPISLEEMLRVSGGAGLSQSNGLLSAKNLGFENGATCDDILMVGIEGPEDQIKIYFHPIEVKVGNNQAGVLSKAKQQVIKTSEGLLNALWSDEENRNKLERKVVRNFMMQMVIVCCEKMELYGVYPEEPWNLVLDKYREALLNDHYTISDELNLKIGRGTIISFKQDVLNKHGAMTEDKDICILEFPEQDGSNYMIEPVAVVENQIEAAKDSFPGLLNGCYAEINEDSKITEVEPGLPKEAQLIDEPVPGPQPVPDAKPPIELDEPAGSETLETTNQKSGLETVTAESHEQGMEILFGQELTNGKPLIWYPNNTDKVFHTNTGIIGTMGTGKTQFTKSLITQLYREQQYNVDGQDLGILIFDYKGDYNENKEDFVEATNAKILKLYHLPFNPLTITIGATFKPLLPIHVANTFKDTLMKACSSTKMGAIQGNTLFSCIKEAYQQNGIIPADRNTWQKTPPTFDTVYRIYQDNEDIKKGDSLAAVLDKISEFEIFECDPAKTKSLFDILHGVVVIDLSGYDSDIQNLVVAITLDLFVSVKQQGTYNTIRIRATITSRRHEKTQCGFSRKIGEVVV